MARRNIALMGKPYVTEEGVASEAITPGHLVKGVTSIAKVSTAALAHPRNFALEREELGSDIDTAYASGDVVKVGAFHQGSRVLALIASGQNITADAKLEAAADGTLRVFASGVVLARALESVNNAAGPGVARLRVEVI